MNFAYAQGLLFGNVTCSTVQEFSDSHDDAPSYIKEVVNITSFVHFKDRLQIDTLDSCFNDIDLYTSNKLAADAVGMYSIRRDGNDAISFRDLQIAEELRERQVIKCRTLLLLLSIPFSDLPRSNWIYNMHYQCFLLPEKLFGVR